MATKNLSEYNIANVPDASNMCFGIVVSEWNSEITGALLDGCVSTLEKHGAIPENIHVKTVPGSFELIYGAHQMTLNDGFDAVIILGCVIRGETPHFDYICEGVTAGIARLNATSQTPIVYGLLTCNDEQQAKDRSGGRLGNKGDECAVVAIKMAKF
ncbi:MAG: 6,7-dimethyl-8-ribityllumazine synthase [Prevotella sp.]|uniref:6,7-dimethyl-8-ribityllumazine synthase n=1 Tax=Prevotella sp. P5-92 TaxID=2024222 RepID=UPI000B972411|nr:6,7-dimethyl-8-ribityllumazine synthase [Prevotella sp. P5-92]MCI7399355.1 6,7-dimethyl-8-ribityllumazine synthase [Prevotella sp.]MDD6819496.1 6,7-dimethyl-8-ribityllumazine synthase [Prevotella sp.]MDY4654387.1 6,7-dimethyl-8-ribityllumazine synthase [Prevotella sp.]OYP54460.1 6,7-dimethyl-8-ribityllumazine synthase [Prevotella sp. P5-92]